MLFCKELFLLIFALAVLASENRTKREMDELVRGGVKPTEAVRTAVAILNQDYPSCSGTIISKKWVVTAAHCFESVTDLENIKVVSGVMNLLSSEAVKTGVKRVLKHPNYKRIKDNKLLVLDWDLALMELKTPLEIGSNENIAIAVLPPPAMKYTGKTIQVGGWGRIGQFSGLSVNHLAINVSIMTSQKCLESHPANNFFPDRMLCAGTETETTCNGDSGAGAIFHGWKVPVILGVVSFGKKGCIASTVYTKLDKYLPWIFDEANIKSLFVVFADDEFYKEYLEEVAGHCNDDSEVVPNHGNILYLSDTKMVMLPSFQAVQGCSVPPYPVTSLHGAVSGIANGKLIICGGYSTSTGTISSCYSLDHGIWQAHQPLTTERRWAAASLSPRGLLVTGGRDKTDTRLSSTEVLTPGGWVAGPPLPVAVSSHCQVYVGDTVYVTGGRSSAVYALTGQTWTKLRSMKNKRSYHACAVLNNNLIVLGGYRGAGTSVEMYDMAQNTWNTGPDLPTDMDEGHSLVVNDKLYAIYGDGKIVQLDSDTNTNTNTWNVVANVGDWHVRGSRPVFPAAVVTRQMINC